MYRNPPCSISDLNDHEVHTPVSNIQPLPTPQADAVDVSFTWGRGKETGGHQG